MLAIHLLLHAVESFYHLSGDGTKIYCDNKGAIYTFFKTAQKSGGGLKKQQHTPSPSTRPI